MEFEESGGKVEVSGRMDVHRPDLAQSQKEAGAVRDIG